MLTRGLVKSGEGRSHKAVPCCCVGNHVKARQVSLWTSWCLARWMALTRKERCSGFACPLPSVTCVLSEAAVCTSFAN